MLEGHTPNAVRAERIAASHLNEARLKEHVSVGYISQLQEANMDREAKHSGLLKKQNGGVVSESGAKRSHAGSTIAEKLDAFIQKHN